MIEYDFSELDRDYITLWSKMAIEENRDSYFEELEVLAEMGQINAIQSWYHMHDVGENPKIDAIASAMDSEDDFNQLYAKGLYLSKTPEIKAEYDELVQKFESMLTGEETYKDGHLIGGTKEAEELLHKIVKLPHIAKISSACKLAEKCGADTNDPIFNQRATEIFTQVIKWYPLPYGKRELKYKYRQFSHAIQLRLSARYPKTQKEKNAMKNFEQYLYYLVRSFEGFDENLQIMECATNTAEDLRELSERKYSKVFAKKLKQAGIESGE